MDSFAAIETIKQVGLSAALAIAILAMMFWLIKRIMADHQQERKRLLLISAKNRELPLKSLKKSFVEQKRSVFSLSVSLNKIRIFVLSGQSAIKKF